MPIQVLGRFIMSLCVCVCTSHSCRHLCVPVRKVFAGSARECLLQCRARRNLCDRTNVCVCVCVRARFMDTETFNGLGFCGARKCRVRHVSDDVDDSADVAL